MSQINPSSKEDLTIPTPISHRWRQIRYSFVPPIAFVILILLTLWIWKWQVRATNSVGQFQVVRVDVVASAPGTVSVPNDTRWQLFDRVTQGQVLGVISNPVTEAALETEKEQIKQLEAEVEAARQQTYLLARQNEHAAAVEHAQLAALVEQRRVEVLKYMSEIALDQARLKRLQAEGQLLQQQPETPESRLALAEKRAQIVELNDRIPANEKLLAEAKIQGKAAVERLQDYPELEPTDYEAILAPLQAEIKVQEKRLREAEANAADLVEIRAPVTGTIVEIFSWPDSNVMLGTPILRIAEENNNFVIAYVRQEQRIIPQINDPVELYRRIPGSSMGKGTVDRVGNQYELLPQQLWRDPRMEEYGLPVRILVNPIPVFRAPSGELLDVRFPLSHQSAAAASGGTTPATPPTTSPSTLPPGVECRPCAIPRLVA